MDKDNPNNGNNNNGNNIKPLRRSGKKDVPNLTNVILIGRSRESERIKKHNLNFMFEAEKKTKGQKPLSHSEVWKKALPRAARSLDPNGIAVFSWVFLSGYKVSNPAEPKAQVVHCTLEEIASAVSLPIPVVLESLHELSFYGFIQGIETYYRDSSSCLALEKRTMEITFGEGFEVLV